MYVSKCDYVRHVTSEVLQCWYVATLSLAVQYASHLYSQQSDECQSGRGSQYEIAW